jgi:hypothetical protein
LRVTELTPRSDVAAAAVPVPEIFTVGGAVYPEPAAETEAPVTATSEVPVAVVPPDGAAVKEGVGKEVVYPEPGVPTVTLSTLPEATAEAPDPVLSLNETAGAV